MPIDAEAKKIIEGGAWASDPGALVQDPGSATPPVTRADGWGPPYSSTLVMEQETLQGLLLAQDSAIIETYLQGVPFYDDEIDYPEHGLTNHEGTLYRAVVANGPATSNVTTPGTDSSIWATVSGMTGRPAAPDQPMATSPNPGELYITWNCPLDNGAEITSFDFRHRQAGLTVWPSPVSLTVPCHTLTGLTNGTAYEFQARAVNSVDDSEWSAIGTGTPAATRSEGGSAFALNGLAGDGEVDLSWLEPNDGGSAITGYTVQWKSGSQSYSSARQASVAAGTTEHTVTGLTNGDEHDFRVRATNSVGNSTWSNEFSATPEQDTQPAINTPTLTARAGGAELSWSVAGNGGSPILGYLVRHRLNNNAYVYDDVALDDASPYVISSGSGTIRAQVLGFNNTDGGKWSDEASLAVTVQAYAGFVDTVADIFRLATLNLSSAALTAVGNQININTTPFSVANPSDISLLASGGSVYLAVVDEGPTSNFVLATVDVDNAMLTHVGTDSFTSVFSEVPTSVALIESGGTVYAGFVDNNGDDFRLATVNLSNAMLTAIGSKQGISSLVGNTPVGVSFIKSGGDVYVGFIDGGDTFSLATVNLSSAVLTAVGTQQDISSLVGMTPTGISLMESAGTVYAGFTDRGNDEFRLATVDLSDASLTAIGSRQDISTLVGTFPAGVALLQI